LAAVLSGFASSPHAIIVKSLNVEPGSSTNYMDGSEFPGMAERFGMGYPTPAAPPMGAEAEAFRSRYGAQRGAPQVEGRMPGMPGAGTMGRGELGGGMGGMQGGGYTGAGVPLRGMGEAGMAAPRPTYNYPRPATSYTAAAPRGGILPTVLDEKQLKVTMQLAVIKLLPEKPVN
jgi:hypothetical protein